jgi:hypothetical protein
MPTIMRGAIGLIPILFSVACRSSDATSTQSASGPPGAHPPVTLGTAPYVNSVSPSAGSTGGDTPVQVSGVGFAASKVTFGDVTVHARIDQRDRAGTRLYLEAPPHAAGTVDVIVTNAGGLSYRLLGGYTYALPQTFDFNGTWRGFGVNGEDIGLGFTIRHDSLVAILCDTLEVRTSPPVPVRNGEFSYLGANGSAATGRIVSATQAVGSMNLPPCSSPIVRVEGP